MINIKVQVLKKIATVLDKTVIVCGNNDYNLNVSFDEEWEDSAVKTARFVYRQDGQLRYQDVVFSGDTVAVPTMANVSEVFVGFYTDNVKTTTPGHILCDRSIKCGTGIPDAPSADVYAQILELINKINAVPAVTPADAGKILMVNSEGVWEATDLPAGGGTTGAPLEALDDASMQEKLNAENVGNIVAYTGETNENYTNGGLYIVEEV